MALKGTYYTIRCECDWPHRCGTPTCDVRSGQLSKWIVLAIHPHTWWYNMSPLNGLHDVCVGLKTQYIEFQHIDDDYD